MVTINFTRNDGPAPFSDSLVMSQAEFDALAPGELDAMKEARFQSWLAIVLPAPDGGDGDG